MLDFIDKSAEQSGTKLNRDAFMAIQGFIGSLTEFSEDGSIVQTNSKGQKLTTIFFSDDKIVEIFEGDKTITKITIFNGDGSITEVIE